MEINGVGGVRNDINEMLSKIREVSSKSKAFHESSSVGESKSFDSVMSIAKNAIGSVNDVQAESDKLKNSYILGEGNVSMSQVIVASQKSKLAFEGLVSVRNKILEAYKEIMNMPV